MLAERVGRFSKFTRPHSMVEETSINRIHLNNPKRPLAIVVHMTARHGEATDTFLVEVEIETTPNTAQEHSEELKTGFILSL